MDSFPGGRIDDVGLSVQTFWWLVNVGNTD